MACRRTWHLAIGLCLLLGFVLLWRSSDSRWHSPWPQTTPVPAAVGLVDGDFMPSGYDFFPRQSISWFWSSPSNLAFLHRAGSAGVQGGCVDLSDGRSADFKPVPWLRSAHPSSEIFFWAASPDGRYLLTVSESGPDRVYTVSTIEGDHRGAWTNRYESHTHPEWLNDSSGFVEWPLRDGRLLARTHWIDCGTSQELDLEQLPPLVVRTGSPLPQPYVLLTKWPVAPGTAAEILVLTPPTDPGAWYRASVPVSAALTGQPDLELSISPTGDSILWLCHTPSQLPRPARQDWFPFVLFRRVYRTTLFVSKPDGNDLQFLGRTQPGHPVGAIRWSPDGSQFAFLHQNTVWLAPLNP